jgi:hypothetical protein
MDSRVKLLSIFSLTHARAVFMFSLGKEFVNIELHNFTPDLIVVEAGLISSSFVLKPRQ